jgi:hypothetical protein
MPKNAFTKREQLICGKLDELEDMLKNCRDPEVFRLITNIRTDATRMELKLISRKTEVEELRTGPTAPEVPTTWKDVSGRKRHFIAQFTDGEVLVTSKWGWGGKQRWEYVTEELWLVKHTIAGGFK